MLRAPIRSASSAAPARGARALAVIAALSGRDAPAEDALQLRVRAQPPRVQRQQRRRRRRRRRACLRPRSRSLRGAAPLPRDPARRAA